jgi:Fur family ferric uptake transcriptional regulator
MKKPQRNTQAKKTILEIVNQSSTALTHLEIQKQTNELCDRVTVYRVLNRLVDEGLVHKIIDLNGVVNFASCKSSCNHKHTHNHVHFSCNSCSEITCVENVVPTFELPEGYQIEQVNITVSGICKKCTDIKKGDA